MKAYQSILLNYTPRFFFRERADTGNATPILTLTNPCSFSCGQLLP